MSGLLVLYQRQYQDQYSNMDRDSPKRELLLTENDKAAASIPTAQAAPVTGAAAQYDTMMLGMGGGGGGPHPQNVKMFKRQMPTCTYFRH